MHQPRRLLVVGRWVGACLGGTELCEYGINDLLWNIMSAQQASSPFDSFLFRGESTIQPFKQMTKLAGQARPPFLSQDARMHLLNNRVVNPPSSLFGVIGEIVQPGPNTSIRDEQRSYSANRDPHLSRPLFNFCLRIRGFDVEEFANGTFAHREPDATQRIQTAARCPAKVEIGLSYKNGVVRFRAEELGQ